MYKVVKIKLSKIDLIQLLAGKQIMICSDEADIWINSKE